jgi:WD40 repeat protein
MEAERRLASVKAFPLLIFGAVVGMSLCFPAGAGSAPDIVWEITTPSALANSIQGVGWSPAPAGQVAFGSTDRWLRTRDAQNGALAFSVLQPHRSGNVDQTIYSSDGAFLAVHNSAGGLDYRVHRAVDGTFLGLLTVAIGSDGLVRFAPDSQLLAGVGGDGTLSRWRLAEFTVSVTVGSGYQRTNTTFNFSADGQLQSATSLGNIEIRRRTDGVLLRALRGGLLQGSTPVAFTPDGAGIAAWSESPSRTTLWRISDGIVLMRFAGATNEGVAAIRFTPGGAALVTSGYLPYVDNAGLWQQKGVIRFWGVSEGALLQMYDAHTGLAVTSPVAWSPDATQFAFGTYEGTGVVAHTPLEVQNSEGRLLWRGQNGSFLMQPDGNVRLTQAGVPGASYTVEVTTNSRAWRAVGVATANSDGYFQFLDTNCHGSSMRLYRSWRVP